MSDYLLQHDESFKLIHTVTNLSSKRLNMQPLPNLLKFYILTTDMFYITRLYSVKVRYKPACDIM